MKDYRIYLVISTPEFKGDERIDRGDLLSCLSFINII